MAKIPPRIRKLPHHRKDNMLATRVVEEKYTMVRIICLMGNTTITNWLEKLVDQGIAEAKERNPDLFANPERLRAIASELETV